MKGTLQHKYFDIPRSVFTERLELDLWKEWYFFILFSYMLVVCLFIFLTMEVFFLQTELSDPFPGPWRLPGPGGLPWGTPSLSSESSLASQAQGCSDVQHGLF